MKIGSDLHSDTMSLLPRLLTAADLPAVELRALELDGEVRRIGRGWCAHDVRETPSDRLAALGLDPSRRLIADRTAAAWVWGACATPPDPVTCCVTSGARARPPVDSGFTVREVVIHDAEIIRTPGGAVTSPLRTAIDIARLASAWSRTDDEVLGRLAAVGGFSSETAMSEIAPARRLAGSRRARLRIARAMDHDLSPS